MQGGDYFWLERKLYRINEIEISDDIEREDLIYSQEDEVSKEDTSIHGLTFCNSENTECENCNALSTVFVTIVYMLLLLPMLNIET